MARRRRDLVRTGISDFNAHPLRTSALLAASLVLICGPCIGIGYAFDEERRLAESTDAGGGLLIGLVLWTALVVWHIAGGGVQGIRDRRQARRREARIEERRSRHER